MEDKKQTSLKKKMKTRNQAQNSITKKARKEKGITLIALVVTIIVLLILAGITITMVIGEDGIIKKAQETVDKTEQTQENTKNKLSNLLNEVNNKLISETPDPEPPATPIPTPSPEPPTTPTLTPSPETPKNISKTESFVGYYVKIDGEYGIIYADLAVGNTDSSGEWYYSDGKYEIPKENLENLKDYYITEETYKPEGIESFEEKPIIVAINPEDVNKKDRFYVMSLKDLEGQTKDGSSTSGFCWYDAAFDNGIANYDTITSVDFGQGYKNTETMIQKWKAGAYGSRDDNETYKDLWGVVEEKFAKGWFVPSRDEWSAFAQELGITESNYFKKNLFGYYMSSTVKSSMYWWEIRFSNGEWGGSSLNYYGRVRLSTTF